MDVMSRVPFWLPLVVFVPVVGFFLYRSIFVLHISAQYIFLFAVVGEVSWTLTEYCLHRFVFHYHPKTKTGKRIFFLLHGVHHDYPRDSNRLVIAPIVSIPLCVFFYTLYYFLIGPVYVNPFFAFYVAGYLFYDMTHYAIHHLNFKSGFWFVMKQHHAIHHYKDADNGYGVTTKFWDHVFRTMFVKTYRDEKLTANNFPEIGNE